MRLLSFMAALILPLPLAAQPTIPQRLDNIMSPLRMMGGHITLGAGHYVTSKSIALPDGLLLEGEGAFVENTTPGEPVFTCKTTCAGVRIEGPVGQNGNLTPTR